MKSCVSAVLLFLVILQSGGMMMCYTIQQEMIREEMREEMLRADTESELLVLTFEEYKSAKVDAREIRWDGQMFDVVSNKQEGGKVVLQVIRDHKEESLLRSLKKFIRHGREDKGRLLSGVLQLSFLSYLQMHYTTLQPTVLMLNNSSSQEWIPALSSLNGDFQGPPPEFIS